MGGKKEESRERERDGRGTKKLELEGGTGKGAESKKKDGGRACVFLWFKVCFVAEANC